MENPTLPFWVRVRTLGESVFCPRAGILSYLQPTDEEEPEYDRPNLDFLPQYSAVIIEEQLALHLRRLAIWSGLTLAAFATGGAGLWFSWKPVVVVAAVMLFGFGRFFSRELRAVLTLADFRRQALQAQPKEPPPDLSASVAVNWWELLKCGFDSIRLQESLRDESLKLVGKPWRVLRKGSLRIPVIKLESNKFEAGRFWIYPQHEIRLAAYAHLLATCERGEVPYAIALFGDSFDGIAIPMTAELKDQVQRQLDAAREVIRRHLAGKSTDAPANTKICSGCPFGYPRKLTGAELKSPPVTIHGVPGRDGRHYHSECGDLFSWTPAHRLAKKIGLLPPEV